MFPFHKNLRLFTIIDKNAWRIRSTSGYGGFFMHLFLINSNNYTCEVMDEISFEFYLKHYSHTIK